MVESSPVFADGFGRRVVRVTGGDAAPTEHLLIDAVLASHAGFAAALQERAIHLHGRRLTSYVKVQRVVADGQSGFEVVTDHVRGWRLADVLDVAESENLTFDIGVVMLLLRQLLPTAALLSTQSRDTASGALGPEHLLLTPQARLVLTDYVFGSAIDALGWTSERLWHTLRVATPAGADRAVSQRGDVVQVGLTVLSLIIGRRLRDDEFPERLEDLVTSARQKTPEVIHAPLSVPLRDWLLRALQLQPKSFATLFDAQMALERLLTAEPSLLAQPAELETAVARFERFMPAFELPVVPELPLLEAPPPGHVPLAVAFDRAPVQKTVSAVALAAQATTEEAFTPAPRSRSGVRRRAAELGVEVMPDAVAVAVAPAPTPPDTAAHTPEGPIIQWPPVTPQPVSEPAPEPAPVAVGHGDQLPHMRRAAELMLAAADTRAAEVVTPASAAPAPQTYRFGTTFAADESAAEVAPAPVELPAPWWRSARAVAALVAVAVVQSLLVAWLLSRPSEGLGGDGELVVQSRPEGARVVIDDKEQGVTPLTVRVSPGTHVLQVRAGSAEPRVIPLQIRAGVQTAQYVELMGVASTGVLEVRSEPSKAKVTIDGQDRGSTPLTLRDVAPGSYQIVLERAGWKSTQVVRVEPGATAQLVVPIR